MDADTVNGVIWLAWSAAAALCGSFYTKTPEETQAKKLRNNPTLAPTNYYLMSRRDVKLLYMGHSALAALISLSFFAWKEESYVRKLIHVTKRNMDKTLTNLITSFRTFSYRFLGLVPKNHPGGKVKSKSMASHGVILGRTEEHIGLKVEMLDEDSKRLGDQKYYKELEEQQAFTCEICFDLKLLSDLFCVRICTHVYCKECISKYVAAKLELRLPRIRCPSTSCQDGILEPDYCRDILPVDVFDQWGNMLCESAIIGHQKLYCPYKDCSALLINDGCGSEEVIINQTECPHCKKSFCAQCKCPWHQGIDCSKFKKTLSNDAEREDMMLRQLATKRRWKRCPLCGFYVSKTYNTCSVVLCTCNNAFCYKCGASCILYKCACSRRDFFKPRS